jgi:hypothetical protein
MYGMAASMPDRRVVGSFLAAFQDVMLEPPPAAVAAP